MNGFDYFTLSWWVINALAMIALVGKHREPIKPGAAAIGVALYGGMIAGLVLTR